MFAFSHALANKQGLFNPIFFVHFVNMCRCHKQSEQIRLYVDVDITHTFICLVYTLTCHLCFMRTFIYIKDFMCEID